MANLKASKKHIRQTKRRTVYNSRLRNRVKKAVKAFETLITNEDYKKAKLELPKIAKVLDKAAKKSVLKKETVSRKISRLTVKLNKRITAAKNVKTAKKSS